MSHRILVVDDEETAREELCEALRDAGYIVQGAGAAADALVAVEEESFEVCISDIRMPGMDGIELLGRLAVTSPETMVIIMTAFGDMTTAIDALRAGATDYVLKPILFDDILGKVERLVGQRSLQREVRNLRRVAAVQASAVAGCMIGESAAMHRIHEIIAKVAPTMSNVLISGESGTGKELFAREIHESSGRKQSPFIPINCAAIPEGLLESELFGHVRGAFTGAVGNKEGLLTAAGDGTILLDEIGDMPMSVQAKLLRAIESREIQPVGSARRLPLRARLIAATNKDLAREISSKGFREDLYFRLAVVEIRLPTLSERRGDIPLLVRYFIERYAVELRRETTGITSEAMRLLVGHSWRGNIRELENTIERALIFCESDILDVGDFPSPIRQSSGDPGATWDLTDATRRFQHQHIQKVLEQADGDKKEAARLLGVSLSSLYRKLEVDSSDS